MRNTICLAKHFHSKPTNNNDFYFTDERKFKQNRVITI
jgi:hypothetical protein